MAEDVSFSHLRTREKKSDAGQRWIIINRALAQSNTNRTMAQPNRILIEKWASPMGYRSNAGQRQTNSKRILTWAIATIFLKNLGNAPSKNIDFVHRSGALARPGNRKLLICAVKFSTSCDAWRPPKCRKNDPEKVRFFFWFWKFVFRHFSWILEGLDNFLRRQHQFSIIHSCKTPAKSQSCRPMRWTFD